MTQERSEENGWHIRKEVTVGHIFTTVAILISVLTYAAKIENRISLSELRIEQLEIENKASEQRLVVQFDKLGVQLNRIEDKIDKKADKK